MPDRFTAKETNWRAGTGMAITHGYMVAQYHNGLKVGEQFVPAKDYGDLLNGFQEVSEQFELIE